MLQLLGPLTIAQMDVDDEVYTYSHLTRISHPRSMASMLAWNTISIIMNPDLMVKIVCRLRIIDASISVSLHSLFYL